MHGEIIVSLLSLCHHRFNLVHFQAHLEYFSCINSDVNNGAIGTLYENGLKYENIEFLDSSFVLQNSDDPEDDRLTDDETRCARKLPMIFVKVFLYLVLCLTFLVKFLKNQFAVISAIVQKNKTLTEENASLKTELNNLERSLSRIYNTNQIHMLKNNLSRPRAWSDETILKSLKYKFACKKGGYLFMKHEGHPLPSTRVLRRRLQGINFNPGILEDVFVFLKEKVDSFTDCEKECLLVVDEVSIIEGKLNQFVLHSVFRLVTVIGFVLSRGVIFVPTACICFMF